MPLPTFYGAVKPLICALIVLVATPIKHRAFAAVSLSGLRNPIDATELVVTGALKRLAVPLTGNSAAVPVPQFEPVPCWSAKVPLVIVVVCTKKSVT